MEWKHFPEEAGFQADGGFHAEQFLGNVAQERKQCGIRAPLDEFQAAMVFRQV